MSNEPSHLPGGIRSVAAAVRKSKDASVVVTLLHTPEAQRELEAAASGTRIDGNERMFWGDKDGRYWRVHLLSEHQEQVPQKENNGISRGAPTLPVSRGTAPAVSSGATAPCPFCGRGDTLTLVVRYRNRHVITCSTRYGGCGSTGPHGPTPDSARAGWNGSHPGGA